MTPVDEDGEHGLKPAYCCSNLCSHSIVHNAHATSSLVVGDGEYEGKRADARQPRTQLCMRHLCNIYMQALHGLAGFELDGVHQIVGLGATRDRSHATMGGLRLPPLLCTLRSRRRRTTMGSRTRNYAHAVQQRQRRRQQEWLSATCYARETQTTTRPRSCHIAKRNHAHTHDRIGNGGFGPCHDEANTVATVHGHGEAGVFHRYKVPESQGMQYNQGERHAVLSIDSFAALSLVSDATDPYACKMKIHDHINVCKNPKEIDIVDTHNLFSLKDVMS